MGACGGICGRHFFLVRATAAERLGRKRGRPEGGRTCRASSDEGVCSARAPIFALQWPTCAQPTGRKKCIVSTSPAGDAQIFWRTRSRVRQIQEFSYPNQKPTVGACGGIYGRRIFFRKRGQGAPEGRSGGISLRVRNEVSRREGERERRETLRCYATLRSAPDNLTQRGCLLRPAIVA